MSSVLTKTRGFVSGFARSCTRGPPSSALVPIRPMVFLPSPATNTAGRSSSGDGSGSAATKQRLFPEEINVLYDSRCNVCKLEMDWLVSRDVRLNGPNYRKLRLTDLEDNFDATDPSNGGIDYATGMAAIYAVKHDGTVYKGVPVFEMIYDQVGLGWIWKINRVPPVRRFLEWGYEIFARNRTKITRGASLEELLALNAAKKREAEKAAAAENCEACANKAY